MIQIPRLEDYGMKPETGFLPNEIPLKRLSNNYYSPWETLMDKFHELLLTRCLREAVLAVCDHSRKIYSMLAPDIVNDISRDDLGEATGIRNALLSSTWIRLEFIIGS